MVFHWDLYKSLSPQQWKTPGISALIPGGVQLSSLASHPTQHHSLTTVLRRRTAVIKVPSSFQFYHSNSEQITKALLVSLSIAMVLFQRSNLYSQITAVSDLQVPPGKKLKLRICVSSPVLKEFSVLTSCFQSSLPLASVCFLNSRKLGNSTQLFWDLGLVL